MAQNKLQLVSQREADNVLANVADAKALPATARQFIATAIKIGVLRLQEGNTIRTAAPFSPAELTDASQTIPKGIQPSTGSIATAIERAKEELERGL